MGGGGAAPQLFAGEAGCVRARRDHVDARHVTVLVLTVAPTCGDNLDAAVVAVRVGAHGQAQLAVPADGRRPQAAVGPADARELHGGAVAVAADEPGVVVLA